VEFGQAFRRFGSKVTIFQRSSQLLPHEDEDIAGEIKGILEVDETRGIMKVVVDGETEEILGAAILGIEGGEIASAIQIAMMGNLSYKRLKEGIFAHPTLAESLNNLFSGESD